MQRLGEWLRRLQYLLNRRRFEDALQEEMEAHREALGDTRRFGSTLRLRERSRDVWGWGWLDDLMQDLRYAVRTLVAHKTYALTAIGALALGIGGTTAVFSVVSGLVLRPLPFLEPERLVQMHGTSELVPHGDAVANLDAFRSASTLFERLAGYEVGAKYMRQGGAVERVMVVRAQGDFFPMLGVPPLGGRTFSTDDPAAVAVMGEVFWRRSFAADPSVLGRTITLDDEAFTVVGIMPESFQFPYGAASLLPGVKAEARTDLWIPLDPPLAAIPRARIGQVTGRLKPGVSLLAAELELAAIARHLEKAFPETNAGRGVELEPLAQSVVPSPVRRVLYLLFGAAGLLLVLACANVANLSLARLTFRRQEVAVRSALGAGGLRLARQFLTESLLLALAGGAAGFLLAWWGTTELLQVAAVHVPRAHEISMDWRVFLFLLGSCALTGVALGVAPALAAARHDAGMTPRAAGGRSTMGGRQQRLRDALVVSEVAIAFVLAVGAVMLIRELVRLQRTDPGLVPTNVMTFHLGHRSTPGTDVRPFYEIETRVRELAAVRAAGLTQMLPLQNWGWSSNSSNFVVRGLPPVRPIFPIQLRYVTPGYFEALGIPIKRGRGITARDDHGQPGVVVINEALARRYFGDVNPVGQVTNRGTIVGVAGDVRQASLDLPAVPELYFPAAQNWSQLPELGMTLVVATHGSPGKVVEEVRSSVRGVNPDLAVFDVKSMDRVIDESLSGLTLYLSLVTGLAALALTLSLAGTYGVITYIASSRAKEFAIRVALGAGRARVVRTILGHGVLLASMGLALGVMGALAAAPLAENLPVTVRPPDALTLAMVASLVAIVAVVACALPAVRAARTDPATALRND